MSFSKKIIVVLIFISFFATSNFVSGLPSGGEYPPTFTAQYDDWYDSWGYKRNEFWGDDGYLPNIAYESLGSDKELAYDLGLWFKNNYAQRVERAEAILDYVQRWTDYGYDIDNVLSPDNQPQPEWAWNADEMVYMFDENQNTIAIGDCEDMSFLCATIYLSAGFDVTIVSPPEHVALLIWLPEYDNANYYWDIPDDDREYGWIWVEATGETNPLGWTPPDFDDGDWISYIIGISGITVDFYPKYPQAEDEVKVQVKIDNSFETINEVLLTYTIENIDTILEMEKVNSVFEATIPKQPEKTRVDCLVTVMGIQDLLEEYDFNYQVDETSDFSFFSLELVAIIIVIILLVFFFSKV
jgi:hypothetical protein